MSGKLHGGAINGIVVGGSGVIYSCSTDGSIGEINPSNNFKTKKIKTSIKSSSIAMFKNFILLGNLDGSLYCVNSDGG